MGCRWAQPYADALDRWSQDQGFVLGHPQRQQPKHQAHHHAPPNLPSVQEHHGGPAQSPAFNPRQAFEQAAPSTSGDFRPTHEGHQRMDLMQKYQDSQASAVWDHSDSSPDSDGGRGWLPVPSHFMGMHHGRPPPAHPGDAHIQGAYR